MSNPSKIHPIEAHDVLMSYPKAKRSRGQQDVSEEPWKGAIAALSTCVSRQDCIEALSTSFRIFNHTVEQLHDEEIASGADAVLCRLLSFLLSNQSVENERHADQASSAAIEIQGAHATAITLSNEIACTCQLAELVYRCSKGVIETSLQKVGPYFQHVIATILEHELRNYRTSNYLPTQNASNALRSVTKILCHYARVQSATLSMARQPRLLSLMISLLQLPTGTIPFEAQHSVLFVLANMACCNENLQTMASHSGGILDVAIQAANIMPESDKSRSVHQYALRIKHTAFRLLLNLSWDRRNKSLMAERNDLFLTIRKTVEMKTLSGDIARSLSGAKLLQARLLALGTLRNIAHTPSPQQYSLCTLDDGMLLNLLCTSTQKNEDLAVRDKAFAVIFNLVTTETAELLVLHPRLLESLVEAASVPTNFEGSNVAESASTMSFRSLHALDQIVSTRGPEECRIKVRRAVEQVNMARRVHDMTVPQE